MHCKSVFSLTAILLGACLHARTAPAQSLALARSHSCAIDADGNAECWGENQWGQLGIGSWVSRPFPSQVVGLAGITALTARGQQTCALVAGDIYCWGYNGFGALGTGLPYSELAASSWPLPVDLGADTATALAVGGSGQHTCAIVAGGVRCWGWNMNGALGDGTTDDRATPVSVDLAGATPIALATGGYHTCALVSSGGFRSVKCWGYNESGQLGNDTTGDGLTPVTVNLVGEAPIAIAAGDFHTCALLPSGDVSCWGSNSQGELGDGTIEDRWTPVPVQFDAGVAATAISAGNHFTCAIVTGGSVQCWGWDLDGALGNGSTDGSSTTPTPVDLALSFGLHATAIAAGGNHACAWLAGGIGAGLRCWGSNSDGELGIYSDEDQPSPVPVTLGDGIFVGVFD
jgi:alpha-tubulin suppressor-like RCC1 family protein